MEKKKIFNGDFIVIVFNEHPYPPCVFCEKNFQPITELRDISRIRKFPTIEQAKIYAEEALQGLDAFDYVKCNELNEYLDKYKNRRII